MNISIFGLGYVGCVSAGCLASTEHKIVGVDLDLDKVNKINSGRATIIEKDIDFIINKQFKKGNITATSNANSAVIKTDISIICVGTPSSPKGSLDFSALYAVSKDIGIAIREKNTFHTIAIRSTIMPGLCDKISEIISNVSGKIKGKDFYVLSNPEFLREGTAVEDYFNPPFILIGSNNNQATEIIKSIYQDINAEILVTDLKVAEILKYVNNSFHALKVVFGNEIGNICQSLKIDSHKVMDIFIKDKQLNISPYYLKPGFAYGGSCLPKDLKALNAIAAVKNIEVPLINSIEKSNRVQINRAFEIICKIPKCNVGYLGVSFKQGTDDLRNSPNIDLLKKLMNIGYSIRIFDRNVYESILVGSNKEYINNTIPNMNDIIDENIETVISSSDLIIIGNKDQYYLPYLQKYNGYIIDLINLDPSLKINEKYIGINW